MCSSASGGRKKSTFASIRMARSKEHASSANGLTAKERSRAAAAPRRLGCSRSSRS